MLNTRSKIVAGLLALSLMPLQAAQELTPLGAEKGANASGSIPAWDGGLKTPPAGYKIGDHHPDPFKDDKPLFEITSQNLSEHRAQLTAGHIALLEKFPSFKMRVFPSRRSAANPEYVYEATQRNATRAKLADNGDNVEGAIIGIPFPAPKNGLEVIWNHLLHYRGETVRRSVLEATVYPNGRINPIRFNDQYIFEYARKNATPEKLNNILGMFKQEFTSPARFAGTILLIHETLDQVMEPRRSWIYNPGQRRVRRAPFVGYDYPAPTSDGLRMIDQFDMFNGAPDRYEWKLVGKQEMIVPYNSYQVHSGDLKTKQILTPNHPNPDLLRYELHRVWVVEATLKKGRRHLFPRRTFYVDEDSWQLLTVDNYDAAGKLWRVSEGHPINYYEVPAVWTALEVHYDLSSGRYIALGLTNEGTPYHFNIPLDSGEFTPSALRRDGQR